MADLSGLGWFAGGMARGIPVGQEMVARQEAIKAAQDQRASREAGQRVQQDIAGYDPNAAIPVQQDALSPDPLAQQPAPGPTITPYQRLDSIRASAMSIPDATIREAALKQVNDLAMAGATHHAILAQKSLKDYNEGKGAAIDVVQNLNNAFKFVDSNAPDNMFTLVPGKMGQPATIKDWKGATVDDSYMYSIGVAAGTNPVLAAEYLRKISSEKDAENRANKLAESTVTYQGRVGEAAVKNATTMESKGVVGDIIDLLRGEALAGAGGIGGGFNDAAIASQNKQVEDAVTEYTSSPDHAAAFTSDQTPLVKSLAQEIYRVTRSTGQPVTAADAALVGAYLNYSNTLAALPSDQQEKIDQGKYKLYTQPLLDQQGNVAAYDTWVGTKPDDKGQYKRITGHPIRLPAYVVDRLMVDNEAKTASAAAKLKAETDAARREATMNKTIEATKEGLYEQSKSGIPLTP